ncbi:MAG: hypothetical protein HY922_03490 [Elusimicrobia bacterium]|nr:hypothetical protein [Elusimicrobiota bacterium]
MRTEGKDIHYGVNFVFAPQPVLDRNKFLDLQRALMDCGVEFAKASIQTDGAMHLVREGGPFEITVKKAGPQVAQILLLSPQPGCSLDLFIKNAEAVAKAINRVWPGPRQIIARDATIRTLFEATSEHAFKELWELRLQQRVESLNLLGRPVLGGGLRFVMPPIQGEADPVLIEVKIESFLQDSRKFFVETQMNWLQPTPPAIPFDPAQRLAQLRAYIENNVIPFILEKSK